MSKLHKILLSSMLIGTLGLGACEDFFDINENPNFPKTAGAELVLPGGQGNLAYIMGNQLLIAGNFWAQHWTQSLVANQYKNLDKYQITQDSYDGTWTTLYNGALTNFDVLRKTAKGDSVDFGAISGLLEAYTFQTLTDGFDKIPFTEALKGLANTSPKYDEGPVVYDGIIKMIDESVSKIADNGFVQKEDIIFEGNMDRWVRFANTLKLRIYLRQIYARPDVAEAGIKALYASGAKFLEEDAKFNFPGGTSRSNPLYQVDFSGQISNNIAASTTLLDYLTETNDPRVDYLFQRPGSTPNPAAPHRGIVQGLAGQPNAPTTDLTAFSRPNSSTIFAPNAPVILMSHVESLLLQAEAAARGLATGASAKDLYDEALATSFAMAGVELTPEFENQPQIAYNPEGTVEEQVEKIITQKWVSIGGTQGFEIWTELRRTGYPKFITPSTSSILGPGLIANRLLYPTSEEQRNSNYPGLVQVQVPVWWDKKN